VHTTCVNP